MRMTKESSNNLKQAAQLIALALDLIKQSHPTLHTTEQTIQRAINALTGLSGELTVVAELEGYAPHTTR